jgi:hypothetical protein
LHRSVQGLARALVGDHREFIDQPGALAGIRCSASAVKTPAGQAKARWA